ACQSTVAADDKQPLTLDAIFSGSDFTNRQLISPHWRPDGTGFTYLEPNDETGTPDAWLQRSKYGEAQLLFRGDALRIDGEVIEISDATWGPDLETALLRGPVETTWHGHPKARHYIFQRDTGKLWPLTRDDAVHLARLSPDGRHAGYVHDNNLYIVNLESRRTRQVTHDGTDSIFNGIFDYGSTMFGDKNAWAWSPDGKRIAFWQLDARYVKKFPMIDRLGDYNEVREFHYPNAGEAHAVYRIGAYDLGDDAITWLDTDHDPDDYLPKLTWAPNSKSLYVQQLTRKHQTLNVLRVPVSGKPSTVVLTETDPAWIDITDDLTPLASRHGHFIWTSERSGFRHIYLYQQDGSHKALTKGDWSVDAVIGVDEANERVYFYGKKDSLIDQH
ncbi:MAG: DPP IV N-terminal domain-containing protein, partial [Pseudomonadales bacterium]